MRLFVGLKPSGEFRDALELLQSRLQNAGIAARYLDPSNLHLTLAFIGEWPESAAVPLPAVDHPFPLQLSRVGVFPEAKVIWAGVGESCALNRLAERVRNNLEESGVPFDPKPFVPHITLGRKPVIPAGFDFSEITVPPAAMMVSDVFLYRSDREENGIVYSVIGSGSGKPAESCSAE